MIRGATSGSGGHGEVALAPLLAIAGGKDRTFDELRFLEGQQQLQADAARLAGFEEQQVATAGGLRQRQIAGPGAELVERLRDALGRHSLPCPPGSAAAPGPGRRSCGR
jgi:hypothetical protein